jgi:hypothetical protein
VKIAAELAELADYRKAEYPAEKSMFDELFSASLDETRAGIVSWLMGKDRFRQKQLMEAWTNFDFRQAVMEMDIR